MTEADILAGTYGDSVTVYRPFKSSLENGETIFQTGIKGLKVYEEIPCALSSHSGGQTEQSTSTASAATEYNLFVRPEIDIRPNDHLVILRLGETLHMVAGRAERQPSHNNIPVHLSKDVL